MTIPMSGCLDLPGEWDPRAHRDLWLRRYHPVADPAVTAVPRLVCCPHSGGSASYFRPLSAALSGSVEVVAVQYPGRQDRRAEPLVSDLRELASRLTAVLADEPGPLALFGHSMGAVLAFEVARRLEDAGRDVAALFVSGHRAPPAARPVLMHGASDADLLREVRRMGGTTLELLDDDEIVELVLPIIRNDSQAAETYRHQGGSEPELRCPIISLVGNEDSQVTPAEADEWRRHTAGGFELLVFPGGHFYLNSFTAALGALISARLTGGRHG
jgi:pyochelin biosynthesis protein PchC